jgi:hypothetical protein
MGIHPTIAATSQAGTGIVFKVSKVTSAMEHDDAPFSALGVQNRPFNPAWHLALIMASALP